jgi:hypothetical protein
MPILIPRGFHSSNDVAPFYVLLADPHGRVYQVMFRCTCGHDFKLQPDASGVCEFKHKRCFEGTLKLDGYPLVPKKKKKKK